jgi:hypothetical protein
MVARPREQPPGATDGRRTYPPNRVSEYAIPSISLFVKVMLRVLETQ